MDWLSQKIDDDFRVMENGSLEDCCVKVAVHVRPLIAEEHKLGCKECVIVVPGSPQVKFSLTLMTILACNVLFLGSWAEGKGDPS